MPKHRSHGIFSLIVLVHWYPTSPVPLTDHCGAIVLRAFLDHSSVLEHLLSEECVMRLRRLAGLTLIGAYALGLALTDRNHSTP